MKNTSKYSIFSDNWITLKQKQQQKTIISFICLTKTKVPESLGAQMDANDAITDSDLLLSITNHNIYGSADEGVTGGGGEALSQAQTTKRPFSQASPPPPETWLSHDFTIH